MNASSTCQVPIFVFEESRLGEIGNDLIINKNFEISGRVRLFRCLTSLDAPVLSDKTKPTVFCYESFLVASHHLARVSGLKGMERKLAARQEAIRIASLQ